MDTNKGFVTMATGDYYCWLAENLMMSYRLFSGNTYPFYAITDQKGAKRLRKTFDGVIVLDEPYYTFMDKLLVYKNTVFEETIFLDADMHIVRDITFLFDEFKQNGADISCVGYLREITESIRPNHFGETAIDKFQLKSYIAFGGGMYYYKKSEKSQECMDIIFHDLVPNYKKYELLYLSGDQMIDEPLIGLGMLICGMRPLDSEKDIMKFHNNMMETLKWNMKERRCQFIWWEGKMVAPAIVHYAKHHTYTSKYVYYNTIVRGKYKKVFTPLIPFMVIGAEIGLFFRLVADRKRRKAFYRWVIAHFTREHFEYRQSQIKSLLGRMNRLKKN